MVSWREEYMQALSERDEREKSTYQRITTDFIEAYTALLDRTAALEAGKPADNSKVDQTSKDPTSTTPDEGSIQARSDLAEALRSNGQLQNRIKASEKELVDLRAKTKADARRITDLSKDRNTLLQKVKDRDDELRGKARFLQNTQDEVVALNLQLNMSEQNVKKLKVENKDLIDRWMARMGKEADEMNQTLE